MDLRNGQITVGEVLRNPRANALFRQEFPQLARSPLLLRAGNMQLNQVMGMGRRFVDPHRMNALLAQLRSL